MVAFGVLLLLSMVTLWGLGKARRASCRGNLKSIGLALRMYSGDNEGECPPTLRELVVQDYLTAGKAYVCPSSDTEPVSPAHWTDLQADPHSSYVYIGRGLTEDCEGHDPHRTVVLHDRLGNHRGYLSLLFADGSVAGFRGRTITEIVEREDFFAPSLPTTEGHLADQIDFAGQRGPVSQEALDEAIARADRLAVIRAHRWNDSPALYESGLRRDLIALGRALRIETPDHVYACLCGEGSPVIVLSSGGRPFAHVGNVHGIAVRVSFFEGDAPVLNRGIYVRWFDERGLGDHVRATLVPVE